MSIPISPYAVATANLLAAKLRDGPVSVRVLEQVQKRREWPTRVIQTAQTIIHRRVVTGRSKGKDNDSLPFIAPLFNWLPSLRSLWGRMIGIGPRPEHIHSPKA